MKWGFRWVPAKGTCTSDHSQLRQDVFVINRDPHDKSSTWQTRGTTSNLVLGSRGMNAHLTMAEKISPYQDFKPHESAFAFPPSGSCPANVVLWYYKSSFNPQGRVSKHRAVIGGWLIDVGAWSVVPWGCWWPWRIHPLCR